jgi:hypothetical protein
VQIKEGLARLRLQGLPLVLPAKLGDGLAFNPFSLQQDCLSVQSRRRRELYLPDSPGPPRALSPKKRSHCLAIQAVTVVLKSDQTK